jgi:hypothetical protein
MNRYEQILRYVEQNDLTPDDVVLTVAGPQFCSFLAELFPKEAERRKQRELSEISAALKQELKNE